MPCCSLAPLLLDPAPPGSGVSHRELLTTLRSSHLGFEAQRIQAAVWLGGTCTAPNMLWYTPKHKSAWGIPVYSLSWNETPACVTRMKKLKIELLLKEMHSGPGNIKSLPEMYSCHCPGLSSNESVSHTP